MKISGSGFKYLTQCEKLYLELYDPGLASNLTLLNNVLYLKFVECELKDYHIKYLLSCPLRKKLTFINCIDISFEGLIFVGKCEWIDVQYCGFDVQSLEIRGSVSEVREKIFEQYDLYLQSMDYLM